MRRKKKQTDRNGVIRYYNADGKFDRKNGPACIYPNGAKKWYRNGKLHREDGPAFVGERGMGVYYVNGVCLRECEFFELFEQLKELPKYVVNDIHDCLVFEDL